MAAEVTKFYDTPDLSQGGHWRESPWGWYRADAYTYAPHPPVGVNCTCPLCMPEKYMKIEGEYTPEMGVPNPAITEREALLRVVRAIEALRPDIHFYPDWLGSFECPVKERWDELGEALEALPKGMLDEE